MRLFNYWFLVLSFTFGLINTANAEEIDGENLEFLEFLSMELLSPQEEMREKLAKFAQKLQIRPDQEIVWQAFVDNSLQGTSIKVERRQQRQQKMRLHGKPISAMEIVETHIEHLNQQLGDAQEKYRIIGELTATMDQSQQALFDKAMRFAMFKRHQRMKR